MSITAAWRTEVGNGKQQSYYGWRPSKKKKEKRKSAERAGNSLEDQEGEFDKIEVSKMAFSLYNFQRLAELATEWVEA